MRHAGGDGPRRRQGQGGLKIKVGYTYGPVVLKDRDVFAIPSTCARGFVSLGNPQQSSPRARPSTRCRPI